MRILTAVLLVLAVTLTGCLSIPANPEKMSPEQIKEWVKDKSLAATCATMNTPYGRGIVVHVGIDKAVVPNGSVKVDDQCGISINNAAPGPVTR